MMQVEEEQSQPQKPEEMQISTSKDEGNPLYSEAIKVKRFFFFPMYFSNQNFLVGNRVYQMVPFFP